jgi:hypothetical protein
VPLLSELRFETMSLIKVLSGLLPRNAVNSVSTLLVHDRGLDDLLLANFDAALRFAGM